MSELDEQLAPELQQVFGRGAVTTAWFLIAYSHHGRVRFEAALVALAGAVPLQASSGFMDSGSQYFICWNDSGTHL